MTGEFVKPSSLSPAIVGTIASASSYNNNLALLAKDSLVLVDTDGTPADGTLGDLTTGSLISDILLRDGASIKKYDSDGVLVETVTFDAAATTSLGTTYLNNPVAIEQTSTSVTTFTAGNIIFSDGSGQSLLSSSITKNISTAWAYGSGGGLDTGSLEASTWYHAYGIYNPTSLLTDVIFSKGWGQATLMPSGYTKVQYIDSVLTDSSSALRIAYRCGKYAFWLNPVLDYSSTISTTSSAIQVSCPPRVSCIGIFNAAWYKTGSTAAMVYIRRSGFNDLAPSLTASPLATIGNIQNISDESGNSSGFQVMIEGIDISYVYARSDQSSTTLRLCTLGWYNPLVRTL